MTYEDLIEAYASTNGPPGQRDEVLAHVMESMLCASIDGQSFIRISMARKARTSVETKQKYQDTFTLSR